MRFRSKERPRGLLSPGRQQRITLGIAIVGVVAIVITLTSRTRLLSEGAGRQSRDRVVSSDSRTAMISDDPSDPLSGRKLGPDEFLTGASADGDSSTSSNAASVLDVDEIQRLDRQTKRTDRDVEPGTAAIRKLLRRVQDDVVGIQSFEWDAWFQCLQAAGRLSPELVAGAEPGRYALFMDSPEYCRGRLWTVRGTLRRLMRFNSRADSFETRDLYDAWISLPDSGSQLIHVVATAADSSLPLSEDGEKVSAEVQFTGIYFKREGYARNGADGRGDISLTPHLLAARIERWVPPQTPISFAQQMTPWMGWIAFLIASSVLALLWHFQISDSLFRRTRTHQLTALPVVVSFDELPVTTVTESLREMEIQANHSEDEIPL
ncbi:MAG: hypothetical protein ACK526_19645 [Planctomyces sp.]